jgi:hypothetical protein
LAERKVSGVKRAVGRSSQKGDKDGSRKPSNDIFVVLHLVVTAEARGTRIATDDGAAQR